MKVLVDYTDIINKYGLNPLIFGSEGWCLINDNIIEKFYHYPKNIEIFNDFSSYKSHRIAFPFYYLYNCWNEQEVVGEVMPYFNKKTILLSLDGKNNVDKLKMIDIIVVGLIIGQSIGRWGNFFNSEAHGLATSLEHLQNLHIPEFIIDGMKINGVYYTPTFLYESIACLIGFIVLCIVRRNKYTKVGTPTALYLIIYGIIRFFIERSRTDSLMFGGFKIAMIVSVVMIIIGVIMLIINSKKGKFEDLYNDKNNKDVIRF